MNATGTGRGAAGIGPAGIREDAAPTDERIRKTGAAEKKGSATTVDVGDRRHAHSDQCQRVADAGQSGRGHAAEISRGRGTTEIDDSDTGHRAPSRMRERRGHMETSHATTTMINSAISA